MALEVGSCDNKDCGKVFYFGDLIIIGHKGTGFCSEECLHKTPEKDAVAEHFKKYGYAKYAKYVTGDRISRGWSW